jgi:hypothetical protein
MGDVRETQDARMWIDGDVFFLAYKPQPFIDLDIAKRIVRNRLNFQGDVSYPLLCDLRQMPRDVSREARAYLAKEGAEGIRELVLVVDSAVARMVVQFFLRVNRPALSTRVFSDYSRAESYVRALPDNANDA